MSYRTLADNGTVRVTARQMAEEDQRIVSAVFVYFNAGEKNKEDYTSFIFNTPIEKIDAGVSENGTLIVLGSSMEGIVKIVEPESETDGITSSIVTTIRFTKGSHRNVTVAPDGNSFTFAGGQFGRVEGPDRWF